MKIPSGEFKSISDVVTYFRNLEDFEDPIYYVVAAMKEDDKVLLRNEVLSWSNDKVSPFASMFKRYFHLNLPHTFLRELMAENLDLALEVEMNAETDTWVRNISFSAMMQKLGVHKSIMVDEEWNKNYCSLEYPNAYLMKEFENNPIILKLNEKLKEIGATIQP